MTDIGKAGTFTLGDRIVHRIGYGAMQLAGPGAFGPPRDHDAALAVLREAVASGVDHIDTSDYYGPYVVNRLIREALHPYPDSLALVTKLGAVRGDDASWIPAMKPADLRAGAEDNLRSLGLDSIFLANLRIVGEVHGPTEGSIAEQFGAMLDMQRAGLIRHIGLSNVTATQLAEAQLMGQVACVQNHYNLVHREDDALIDTLAAQGVAYVPFFPLGGFSPVQSDALTAIAGRMAVTPMQLALAWLLRRSPNILLIPGTSSVAHLRENLAVAEIALDDTTYAELDAIGAPAPAE